MARMYGSILSAFTSSPARRSVGSIGIPETRIRRRHIIRTIWSARCASPRGPSPGTRTIFFPMRLFRSLSGWRACTISSASHTSMPEWSVGSSWDIQAAVLQAVRLRRRSRTSPCRRSRRLTRLCNGVPFAEHEAGPYRLGTFATSVHLMARYRRPSMKSGIAVTPPLDNLDDMALVERAKRQDGAALRLIMERHNRRLYRMARSILRDDAEAEDVVQEAYLRAFTHLDSFRGEARLATWLTRIAL